MHRSVSRAPKGLKLFVDIADEPNSAVFYLDHLMASAYLSGADGYFVYGEPGNPNQPPAININGVEISGYYQDQGTMVDDGGLEEAMRGMTMVEGNGDSAVGKLRMQFCYEEKHLFWCYRKQRVTESFSVSLL